MTASRDSLKKRLYAISNRLIRIAEVTEILRKNPAIAKDLNRLASRHLIEFLGLVKKHGLDTQVSNMLLVEYLRTIKAMS